MNATNLPSIDLKFSTNENIVKSKTKCIIFSRKKVYKENYAPICLDNVPLPYVDKLVHLGITVQSDNSMAVDMSIKRATVSYTHLTLPTKA